jgi:TPP-dependent pyruvate/acetoin dehydrogenase alpha subunit
MTNSTTETSSITSSRAVGDNPLALFASMAAIRRVEEVIQELRSTNEVQGSVHLGIGQEAVASGVCAALRLGDPVYATYRGHGWAVASGVQPEGIFAELLGRVSGVNRGRGGSAYFSHAPSGFMGENSIVGAGAPIANGAALAARFQGSDRVAVTVFGDGATNQGAVHEALNLAAAMKLPVIFVCENNVYSELTPIADVVGNPRLHERAAAYGMNALEVDGNDVQEMCSAASEAVERARGGGGPTFIEAHTYRLCGHYFGDAEGYRTKQEVAERSLVEPLVVAVDRLRASGVEQSQIDDTLAAVDRAIDDALSKARSSSLVPTDTVKEHLYG